MRALTSRFNHNALSVVENDPKAPNRMHAN